MNTAIIIKLKEFKDLPNLKHIKTIFEISTTKDMSDIIDRYESTGTDDKTMYLSTVSVPLTGLYYGRATRVLEREDKRLEEHKTSVKEIHHNDQKDIIVMMDEIVIAKPIIELDTTKLTDDNETTITVKTSEFLGTEINHHSSNLIVVDTFGDIVYKELGKQDKKTEFTIDKSKLDIKNKRRLKFMVSHNIVGVESAYGVLTVDINVINYEIENNYTNVTPGVDCKIKLKKVDLFKPFNLYKVELRKMLAGTLEWSKVIDADVTEFTIPGEILTPNNNYYLDIYDGDKNGNMNTRRVLLEVDSSITLAEIESDRTYNKKFKVMNKIPRTHESSSVTTKEILINRIPAILNNSELVQLNKYYSNGDIVRTTDTYKGMALLNPNNDNTYMDITGNNIVMVNTLNINNKSTFMFYDYDSINNTYLLINVVELDKSDTPVGYDNNISHIGDKNYIFIPKGLNDIYTINGDTGVAVNISMLPKTTTHRTLIPIGKMQFLIICDDSSFIFNYRSKTYSKGMNIPSEFLGKDLKHIRLPNNDVFIYKKNFNKEVEEDNILYYDFKKQIFEVVKTGLTERAILDTATLLKNGDILFTSNRDSNIEYILFN